MKHLTVAVSVFLLLSYFIIFVINLYFIFKYLDFI